MRRPLAIGMLFFLAGLAMPAMAHGELLEPALDASV